MLLISCRACCGPRSLLHTKYLSIVTPARSFGLRLMLRQSAKDTKPPKIKRSEMSNLLMLAKPERWRICGAVTMLFVSSGVIMALPYAIGRIIDIIYNAKEGDDIRKTLVPLCQGLAAIFVVGAMANFGRVYLIQTSGQRIVRQLRERIHRSIMQQEMAFFDKNRTGELINRLSTDTTVVASSITQNISDGLRAAVTALGSTSMMLYTSPMLAMVGLAIVPIVGVMSVPFGRYMKRLSRRVQDALAESTQVAEERISNMRTVRAFGKENYEMKSYQEKIDQVLRISYSESLARAIFFGTTGLMGNCLIIAVLYAGGLLVSTGDITIGQLSSFMLYVVFVGTSVNGLSSFYTDLMKGLGASTRLWDLTHRVPLIPITTGLIPDKPLVGNIRLFNVAFSYPSRPDVSIFTDLNLEVPAGKVTAVVGPSGSGKSTIAALLLRLYDIDKGDILIDGVPVQHLSPMWLRQHIGIVAQEPILFSSSIRENILYGAADGTTEDQIIEVAKQANAWRFIENFPQGLDTVVGERGVMLSGGQRQRVAIARALLKNPHFLILDEATSALDAESEHLVQEALHRLMVGRTVVVIAHRLSTIKNANNIAVLSDGQIAEQGTYSQLMSLDNGVFNRLIHKQAFSLT